MDLSGKWGSMIIICIALMYLQALTLSRIKETLIIFPVASIREEALSETSVYRNAIFNQENIVDILRSLFSGVFFYFGNNKLPPPQKKKSCNFRQTYF